MHTVNQLLFGVTLGLYFALISHFLFRDRIIRTFEALYEERRAAVIDDEGMDDTSKQDNALGLREQARQGIKRGKFRNIPQNPKTPKP